MKLKFGNETENNKENPVDEYLSIYKKEFPDKRPISKRDGVEYKTKHYKNWLNEHINNEYEESVDNAFETIEDKMKNYHEKNDLNDLADNHKKTKKSSKKNDNIEIKEISKLFFLKEEDIIKIIEKEKNPFSKTPKKNKINYLYKVGLGIKNDKARIIYGLLLHKNKFTTAKELNTVIKEYMQTNKVKLSSAIFDISKMFDISADSVNKDEPEIIEDESEKASKNNTIKKVNLKNIITPYKQITKDRVELAKKISERIEKIKKKKKIKDLTIEDIKKLSNLMGKYSIHSLQLFLLYILDDLAFLYDFMSEKTLIKEKAEINEYDEKGISRIKKELNK